MSENSPARVPFQFPRVLAWEVTRRCPLKCRHCRAAAADVEYARELDTAECRRVLASLAGPGAPMIIWTGGEPMERPDVVELVREATRLGLRSVMAPCGLLVTEARLRELKDAGVTACSFSLDGPDAAAHDAFRGVAGAYDNVVRAMGVARKIGLAFQVNVTVSKLNAGRLEEIWSKAQELGAAKVDLFFLVPVGRGQAIAPLALDEDETKRVLDWAFEKAAAGGMGVKETCCPMAPAYWNGKGSRPCGCLGGRGFAFLSHVGDLQTCGFISRSAGNVRDFDCDFRALVAAAANPLGAQGTCRGSCSTKEE